MSLRFPEEFHNYFVDIIRCCLTHNTVTRPSSKSEPEGPSQINSIFIPRLLHCVFDYYIGTLLQLPSGLTYTYSPRSFFNAGARHPGMYGPPLRGLNFCLCLGLFTYLAIHRIIHQFLFLHILRGVGTSLRLRNASSYIVITLVS